MNNPPPAIENPKQQFLRLMFRISFLLASITLFAGKQSKAEDSILFKANGAFFALSVADANASSKWYREKLGMRVIKYIPKQDKVTVAILESEGLIIELIQNDDALPLEKVAPGIQSNILVHGFFKAGVIVEDLNKLITVFRQRGVEIAYGPYGAKADQRANVIIKDNSGNLIQFFEK